MSDLYINSGVWPNESEVHLKQLWKKSRQKRKRNKKELTEIEKEVSTTSSYIFITKN